MAKRKYKVKRVKRIAKPKSKRDFESPQYMAWRDAVKKRDGKCCKWPQCKAKRHLNIHHIKRWADFPSLRYEIGNGITLCKKHHDAIRNKELQYEQLFYIILQQELLKKLNKLRDNGKT